MGQCERVKIELSLEHPRELGIRLKNGYFKGFYKCFHFHLASTRGFCEEGFEDKSDFNFKHASNKKTTTASIANFPGFFLRSQMRAKIRRKEMKNAIILMENIGGKLFSCLS
jgi:hypothetical protein